MLKTLLLIRHAKAAAFGSEPGDHGRPLAQKGLEQTKELAHQMQGAGVQIDLALVSTAARTRQTWAGLAKAAPLAKTKFIEELYLASAEQIDHSLWLHADLADHLAIIGHNPGMAMFAWKLLEAGGEHNPRAEHVVRSSFKTAFAARFDMSQIKPILVQLYDPRLGLAKH